jgi:hypothetical protein
MKILSFIFIVILANGNRLPINEKNRTMVYQDETFTTTYDVPARFIGRYDGEKTGFLVLNTNGTGEYKYDIFGYAPASCKRKTIYFEWGFILDDNGNISKNQREYGFSYPFLMKSTGETSFQGCRSEVMLDYILVKDDGLHVSSSDDWRK